MPSFDVDPERITVFHVGDEYLFSYYFEREDVFEAVREYYVDDAYRFEVPATEFEDVRERLADYHYALDVVEDLEPYVVVTGKYDQYADILRQSVANWERRGHRFFLMQDELAVREAVEAGATPVAETEFVVGL